MNAIDIAADFAPRVPPSSSSDVGAFALRLEEAFFALYNNLRASGVL
jgi:hypothetical protein